MLRYNDEEIKIGHFPDGTLLLKDNENHELWDNKILWFYENNEELVALMFFVKHLRDNGISHLSLYMPYVPNARQDRVKTNADVFTLKYFCEIINSLNFSFSIFHTSLHKSNNLTLNSDSEHSGSNSLTNGVISISCEFQRC